MQASHGLMVSTHIIKRRIPLILSHVECFGWIVSFNLPHPRLPALRAVSPLACACQDARLYKLLRECGKMGIFVGLGGNGPNGALIAFCKITILSFLTRMPDIPAI